MASFHYWTIAGLSHAIYVSPYLFLIRNAFFIPHSSSSKSVKSLFRIQKNDSAYWSFGFANKYIYPPLRTAVYWLHVFKDPYFHTFPTLEAHCINAVLSVAAFSIDNLLVFFWTSSGSLSGSWKHSPIFNTLP